MSGRVALVTGSSRGIGRAIALELGRRGHPIAVNYARSKDAALEVTEKIESAGGLAITAEGDVSDEDQVRGLFDEVRERLGDPLVLVNNAGVTRDSLLVRMSTEAWDEVLSVNLRSAFLCTKAAMRGMLSMVAVTSRSA